jgi:hypothetical protein
MIYLGGYMLEASFNISIYIYALANHNLPMFPHSNSTSMERGL